MKHFHALVLLLTVGAASGAPIWKIPCTGNYSGSSAQAMRVTLLDLEAAKGGLSTHVAMYDDTGRILKVYRITDGEPETGFSVPKPSQANQRITGLTVLHGYTGSGWALLIAMIPNISGNDGDGEEFKIIDSDGREILSGQGVEPQVYFDGLVSYILTKVTAPDGKGLVAYKLSEGINVNVQVPLQKASGRSGKPVNGAGFLTNGRFYQESASKIITFQK